MLFGRLSILSGVAVALYGYHVGSASLLPIGLALVPAALVLRWAIMPPHREAPVASVDIVPRSEAPPSPPSLREVDILILDVTARLKAARERQNGQ
jgi:hypothetical protein